MAGVGKKSKNVVVDASYVLGFLLPDEQSSAIDKTFLDYSEGTLQLFSTTLLPYEVINGLWAAKEKDRIDLRSVRLLASTFLELEIKLEQIDFEKALEFAMRKKMSIYDSSYVILSRYKGIRLLTLDKKLLGI